MFGSVRSQLKAIVRPQTEQLTPPSKVYNEITFLEMPTSNHLIVGNVHIFDCSLMTSPLRIPLIVFKGETRNFSPKKLSLSLFLSLSLSVSLSPYIYVYLHNIYIYIYIYNIYIYIYIYAYIYIYLCIYIYIYIYIHTHTNNNSIA